MHPTGHRTFHPVLWYRGFFPGSFRTPISFFHGLFPARSLPICLFPHMFSYLLHSFLMLLLDTPPRHLTQPVSFHSSIPSQQSKANFRSRLTSRREGCVSTFNQKNPAQSGYLFKHSILYWILYFTFIPTEEWFLRQTHSHRHRAPPPVQE